MRIGEQGGVQGTAARQLIEIAGSAAELARRTGFDERAITEAAGGRCSLDRVLTLISAYNMHPDTEKRVRFTIEPTRSGQKVTVK
jgi:hypothetical protein